ncbi:MAG TPA: glycosyltransferase family 4 protein [Tepidisphaeraceae bacterium]
MRSTILTTSAGLAKAGVSATIVSLNDGPMCPICRQAGLALTVLNVGDAPTFLGSIASKPMQLWRIARFIAKAAPTIRSTTAVQQADAVHIVMPNFLSLATRSVDRSWQRVVWEMPNVIGSRYPFQLNRRLYQRSVRRNSVIVLANSAYTAATLEMPGHAPIATVWQPPTDASRFNPDVVQPHPRASLGFRADDIVFALAARLVEEKGFLTAVEALRHVSGQLPTLKLLLIGGPIDSEFAQRLRGRVAELALQDRVHFTGEVADVERYYLAADVVMNLRHDPEPLGLTVVEAMLMRRPMLVHALGGPAETVVDGLTGWHIDRVTPATVAAGIERAMSDRGQWPAMGEAGRARALANYSTDVLIGRYIDIVSERLPAAAHV